MNNITQQTDKVNKRCKKYTQEIYIKSAKLIHKDKYDYSKTVVRDSTSKIIIICPIHGEFEQGSYQHINGQGCKSCGFDNIKYTTKEYIEKCILKHGYKYDYSKTVYKNARTKVDIICPIHGEFSVRANMHLYGSGCKSCGFINMANSNIIPFEEFLERVKPIHGDKFIYLKENYIKNTQKMDIICPKHGVFVQSPKKHLETTHGCPKCADDLGVLNGHSRSNYIIKSCGRTTAVYVIRCFNDIESFYKIGISFNWKDRYYENTERLPYKFEVIQFIEGDAGTMWDFELFLKRLYNSYHYVPKLSFHGSKTECYIL